MFQNFATCRSGLAGLRQSARLRRAVGDSFGRWTLPQSYHGCLRERTLPTDTQGSSVRYYSENARRPGFFTKFMEMVKKDMSEDEELKKSLKKFKEETQKLEESENLRLARQKFQAMESKASEGTSVLKEKLGSIKGKVQEVVEEVGKSELGKKAGQIGEEISKSAKEAAETISEKSQAIGKSNAFQTISQTAEVVREELDPLAIHPKFYVSPKRLRKRKEVAEDSKHIQPNTEATGIELHKDSKFYQSWQKFKETNPYMNKLLGLKMKYDESDSAIVQHTRVVADGIVNLMSGLWEKSDISKAMTEICKIDPTFDKSLFLRDCHTDYIPNILEAMIRGNLEILKDWCYEAPYNAIAYPIKEAQKLGYYLDSRVLDIDNLELVMGGVVQQGPILGISFNSQQVMCVRDSKHKIIEGDPQKVLRVQHTWYLCRDRTEPNPKAAWRLLECSMSTTEQLL